MLSLPATAEQWRAALADTPLPILSTSSKAARALAVQPSLSATQLAKVATGDASLTLQLLSRANTAVAGTTSSAAEDGVFNVSHGVALLGVESAAKSVLEMPTIDTLEGPGQRDGMVAALAKTYLAGELASSFSRRAGDKSRAAAQTRLLGELVGWCGADNPAERFSAVWDHDPTLRAEKEREQFGISLAELSTLTAETLGLGHALAAQQQHGHAAIAADLAHAVSLGWHTGETARLTEQAADLLQMPIDQVETSLHRVTAAAARTFTEPSAMHAARTLLLDEDDATPGWFVAPAAREPATAVGAADIVPADPQEQCAAVLAAYIAGKTNIHHTFQGLTATMKAAFGFRRVVVALLTKRRDKLAARFSSEPDDLYLSQFVIDLQSGGLFAKLLEKPAGLLATPEKLGKIRAQCPASIQSLLSSQGFCVMSLFVGAKPVGLVLAEVSEETDRDTYTSFKQVCMRTSGALEKVSQQAKAA